MPPGLKADSGPAGGPVARPICARRGNWRRLRREFERHAAAVGAAEDGAAVQVALFVHNQVTDRSAAVEPVEGLQDGYNTSQYRQMLAKASGCSRARGLAQPFKRDFDRRVRPPFGFLPKAGSFGRRPRPSATFPNRNRTNCPDHFSLDLAPSLTIIYKHIDYLKENLRSLTTHP